MPASNTYEPIATTTLTSAVPSVTFGSIPQTYTDLIIVQNSIGTVSNDSVNLQFNSDTGSNYSVTRLTGNGSAAASNRYSNQPSLQIGDYQQTSSEFAIYTAHIMNYSNSTTNKTVLSRSNTASQWVALMVGLWRNTAAITSIRLLPGSGNFSAGSTFTLYGIKAA
jgi:hypothetical protein